MKSGYAEPDKSFEVQPKRCTRALEHVVIGITDAERGSTGFDSPHKNWALNTRKIQDVYGIHRRVQVDRSSTTSISACQEPNLPASSL